MQMVGSQACYSQPVDAEQQTYSQVEGSAGLTHVHVTDAEVHPLLTACLWLVLKRKQ